MKNSILISIKHPLVSVILFGGKKKMDEITWKDNNDLSLNLLKNIDNLLSKNKLKIKMVNKIEVNSLQTTYSSSRIAKIVAKTTNYYLTNCHKNVK